MKHSPKNLRAFIENSIAIKIAILLTVLGCLVALVYAAPAHAQATRTWVSGVGDDANPCSRTAPCKTFAGAISKTAASGEINCLDSGGFGALTITKAITISCEGVIAGVLVSGTNGIVVQAAPTDRVILRGLDIDGLGTGINGIRFLAGGSLLVEKCIIYRFTTNGIDIAPGNNAGVAVKDTVITNMGNNGIRVAGGIVSLAVDHVSISVFATNGVELAAPSTGTVNNSLIYAGGGGVVASAGGALLHVDNTELSFNNIGANASAGGAKVTLNNDSFYSNNTAIAIAGGAVVVSANNNKFADNSSDGPNPNGAVTIK